MLVTSYRVLEACCVERSHADIHVAGHPNSQTQPVIEQNPSQTHLKWDCVVFVVPKRIGVEADVLIENVHPPLSKHSFLNGAQVVFHEDLPMKGHSIPSLL